MAMVKSERVLGFFHLLPRLDSLRTPIKTEQLLIICVTNNYNWGDVIREKSPTFTRTKINCVRKIKVKIGIITEYCITGNNYLL